MEQGGDSSLKPRVGVILGAAVLVLVTCAAVLFVEDAIPRHRRMSEWRYMGARYGRVAADIAAALRAYVATTSRLPGSVGELRDLRVDDADVLSRALIAQEGLNGQCPVIVFAPERGGRLPPDLCVVGNLRGGFSDIYLEDVFEICPSIGEKLRAMGYVPAAETTTRRTGEDH